MTPGMIFLVLAYVLSQFYRAFLAVLSPVLELQIGASAEDLAMASGLWFVVFAAMQIPYEGVDLDSVAYQQDDLGGKIRGVLLARTGQPTIPQIYIGGEHIGGATDLFDECQEGTMVERLIEHGVSHDGSIDVNPYELLPKWLHPRQSAA